jgi:DMSO/TMAO reductase YedYZ molybdopterin-dependent catalytic subunit
LIETNPVECGQPTVVAPTLPATIPGYTELDRSTGLHITGKYVVIDLASYRLEVTGMVDNPLKLSYEDLRCLPRVKTSAPILCPGFFEDAANWAGASLAGVLELAKVQPSATMIRLTSADGYSVTVIMAAAQTGKNFLAYEWNGEPLPILHGFPVRAVFPGMVGGYWLKWLVKIEAY